jgi:hypothetical protein
MDLFSTMIAITNRQPIQFSSNMVRGTGIHIPVCIHPRGVSCC